MRQLGIPDELVVVDQFGPFVEDTELTDTDTPPISVSGIQMQVAGKGPCTIGFITVRAGTDLGAVTVHHCTPTRGGGADLAYWWQSNDTNGNKFGKETIDPAFFTNSQNSNCPVGDQCRYSQGAFATKDTTNIERGYIARTLATSPSDYVANNNCELTIDSNKPNFPINQEGLSVQGASINKVGHTTGWTTGSVQRTCVPITYTVGGTDYTYLCQDIGNYDSDGGDSGSPVFERDSSNSDLAHLFGIHIGRNPTNTAERVFSPIGNVYLDLGP